MAVSWIIIGDGFFESLTVNIRFSFKKEGVKNMVAIVFCSRPHCHRHTIAGERSQQDPTPNQKIDEQ